MHGLMTDVRHAVRGLRRGPAFALVAILSLALGIGANAAIFSAITTLLRDPLPVDRPDELVVAYWRRAVDFDISQIQSGYYTDAAGGADYRTNFSYPLYRAMRDAAPDAGLFAFTYLRSLSVGIGDQPPAVANGLFADDEYFATLRPGIALGRPLTAADNRPDAPLAVVLSHAYWRRAFGGDAAAIGHSIRLNGAPAEIVGVTAAGFDGLSRTGSFPPTDVTMPLSAQPAVYTRWSSNGESMFTAADVFWLRVMGRVPEQDNSEELTQRLAAAFRSVPSSVNEPVGPPVSLVLAPGAHGPQITDADTGRLLWLLMAVAGVVLLIACVNLAALMLARGVEREREVAVRRALGSGRLRLIRQSLMEGLVLAAAGTAVGLLLVVWARNALGALLSSTLRTSSFWSVDVRIDVDPTVIAVSAALCIGATLLFGLLPALRLTFVDPADFLKHRAAGQRGPKLTAGRALIALQIAASVPLVVGASLLLRSVANLNAVEVGFDPNGLVLFRVDPGYTRIPPEQHADLYMNLLQRLEAVPGVRSATLIENPLLSGLTSNNRFMVDGEEHNLYMNSVGPRFLETMGMRLIDGRMPDLRDRPGYPLVGALNETAARELFGGASPIGRTLDAGRGATTIVGVVSDSRYDRQRAPVRPTLYDAALQRRTFMGSHIVLRTDAAPARLEQALRQAVADVDRDLPIPAIRTQLDEMARTTARERVFTVVLSAFGAFALLLASIGLHGVTAYAVSRRTAEIGVRVALGARPTQVLAMVLRQVTVLALAGLAIGVPAAVAAAPVIGSLLFGVAPNDAALIAVAATVMLAVAIGAGLQPAIRAARMDPLTALRAD